jgi:hypothetical protein
VTERLKETKCASKGCTGTIRDVVHADGSCITHEECDTCQRTWWYDPPKPRGGEVRNG